MKYFLFFLTILGASYSYSENLFQEPRGFMSDEDHLENLHHKEVIRNRLVTMDKSQLLQATDSKEPLIFNLFDDIQLTAEIKESKKLEDTGSYFLSGSLREGGVFTLLMTSSGIVRGEVHSSQGIFTIDSDKNNEEHFIIREVDTSNIPQGNDVIEIDPETLRSILEKTSSTGFYYKEHSQKNQEIETNNTIDVLAVYTPGAKNEEGGKSEIESAILNEVEKTNQALRDSGLENKQIRLVGMEEVNYTQDTKNMKNDLDALTFKQGHQLDLTGQLDEVHTLRKKYGADFVHLFVNNFTADICGIAYAYTLASDNKVQDYCQTDEPGDLSCVDRVRKDVWKDYTSFSVSAINQCPSTYTFSHELGHSMGLSHDRHTEISETSPLNIPNNFPFTNYGFSYVNQNFEEGDSSGVSGEDSSLTGPAHAYLAIKKSWDFLTKLMSSGVSCQTIVFDKLGDIETERGSNRVSVPPEGITKTWDIINDTTENGIIVSTVNDIVNHCLVDIQFSDLDFVRIEKPGNGQVRLFVEPNTSCDTRTGELTMTLDPETSPSQTVQVEQELSPSPTQQKICEQYPDGIFSDVDYLDLSHSNIEDLDYRYFSDFRNLNTLDLFGNNITSIPFQAFRSLINLEELNLSKNDITDIDPSAFLRNSELGFLWLHENELENLPADVFSRNPGLRALSLDNNNITNISEVLSGLSYLRYLWLNNNNLTTLPNLRCQLPNLRYLNISSNEDVSPVSEELCHFFKKDLRYFITDSRTLESLCPSLYMITKGGLYRVNKYTGKAFILQEDNNKLFGEARKPFGIASLREGADDTLYMLDNETKALYKRNTSGLFERVGNVTDFDTGETNPQGLTAIGNTLYMVGNNLYTLDKETGVATRVGGSIQFEDHIKARGLASIGETLYMIGVQTEENFSALYTLNMETGAAEQVGSAVNFNIEGVSGRFYPTGLTAIDNTLYMVGSRARGTPNQEILYELNTKTGTAEQVGDNLGFKPESAQGLTTSILLPPQSDCSSPSSSRISTVKNFRTKFKGEKRTDNNQNLIRKLYEDQMTVKEISNITDVHKAQVEQVINPL